MADISWQVLFLALVLDITFGDPRRLPHPIVWMGNAISFFEPWFRKRIPSPFYAGLCFALFLIAAVWCLGVFIVKFSFFVHPLAGDAVQVLLLFYCFSSRTLVIAAMDVARPLAAGDISKARKMVGYIVGRQTQNLDETGITRATVETVAENFVDGFLSPLFFALVFGVPGALAYKMINTLDSMVGYKNETYIMFGRAAARMDDAVNYIPARLSVLVIGTAAGLISGIRGKRALKTAFSQGRCHKSPNAGYPEAAFAGALKVRLGGPNIYHGTMVDKPYIGREFKDPKIFAIHQACQLMMFSVFISALAGGGVLLIFSFMSGA